MAKKNEGSVQGARAAQRSDAREKLLAKRPRTEIVEILTDEQLVIDHDRAMDALTAARRLGRPPREIAALQAEVERLMKAVGDATVVMRFESIGPQRYEDVVNANPPDDELVAEKKRNNEPPPPYDPDTFPIALIAATLADPKLSEEDVASIWNGDDWNGQEKMQLFLAAMSVNTRARRVADLGKGFG